MPRLHHAPGGRNVRRAHFPCVFNGEGGSPLHVNVLTRCQRIDKGFRMQVRRSGDEDGIHTLCFQQAPIVFMNCHRRTQLLRFVQSPLIDVRNSHDLCVWQRGNFPRQLRSALPIAHNTGANTRIRPQHRARGNAARPVATLPMNYAVYA